MNHWDNLKYRVVDIKPRRAIAYLEGITDSKPTAFFSKPCCMISMPYLIIVVFPVDRVRFRERPAWKHVVKPV